MKNKLSLKFSVRLMFFFSILIIPIPPASSLSFDLNGFDQKDNLIYNESHATFNGSEINLTQYRLQNATGRVEYGEPLVLWNSENRRLIDFSTRFSFIINSFGQSAFADGLAFFLSPFNDSKPPYPIGGNFGLFRNGTLTDSTVPTVAVEFDTYSNKWDPNYVHIGIDVDSIVSNVTAQWQADDEIKAGREATAWVSYNSITHNLSALEWASRRRQVACEGGFGSVYNGRLDSRDVAVKRVSSDSAQGINEYIAEVTIISRLRDGNLVELVGWCHRRRRREYLLVYKFMPNRSLNKHLYDPADCMPWPRRYNFAMGLAAALRYLHHECQPNVVHRDVKHSNVMLDSNFNAKLGDFGLARKLDRGEEYRRTTLVIGTPCYVAPEYLRDCQFSRKTDVYSFGIVALEIASGKSIQVDNHLVNWVRDLYEQIQTAADPRL
ncbi:L-type lectin-domain containing receptor kinase SIT2-like [Zingiber officinale]|uniref:L-type lectin-domain containing receptor kinase SIT2-like n=1 Tax=Zingiber officinale TaxID=94328 RepID=UPI001C4CFAA6|nr:L-type lectin-domain containing receptor kinase SIT2-like [Zingiber officinale]